MGGVGGEKRKIPSRVVCLCDSKASGCPSLELQPPVNAWMLIKECKFHVSGPRLTHTQGPEVHERERADTHESMHAHSRRHTKFWGLIPMQRKYPHTNNAHTQLNAPNQPLSSPFVLKDRDKTVGEANDLKRVKLRKLIIQKLHVHKYVYQYTKSRHKVGQNFRESFAEGGT